jgi:hypothetical protein
MLWVFNDRTFSYAGGWPMTWLGFFALQLSFIFMIFGLGYWGATRLVCFLRLKKTFWIDRLCIGAFVIVFLFAILGLVVLLFPWDMRQTFSGLILATVFFASTYVFFRNKYYKDLIESSRFEKIFLIGVVAISGLGLAISLLPVKLPNPLFDGPYVAKHDYLGVRVQYITGNLPTDNSLPHVISEYLLRDISFKNERPVMPGQEVSNRPILVSLILVPFRAAFSLPPKLPAGLPKYNYVGTVWPDFSVLMQDDFGYLFSLSLGITLNALIFLAVGAFAVRAQDKSTLVAAGVVVLMLSSPYFIFQTIFTWPKELAAFFILYSVLLYYKLKAPILAGGFLAFGYLSHPYAIVFLIGFILHAAYVYMKKGKWQGSSEETLASEPSAFDKINDNSHVETPHIVGKRFSQNMGFGNILDIRYFGLFLAVFTILVAPWFMWTKLILHIPSDLVSQNFYQSGQGIIDFFWVRPVNYFNTLLPAYLLQYPFDLNSLVLGSVVTMPGAIGLLIVAFSLMYLFENEFEKNKVFLIYVPSLLLILIFSNRALPALHGLQGPFALLLLYGVIQMQKVLNNTWVTILLGLQVIINMLLLGCYFYKLV